MGKKSSLQDSVVAKHKHEHGMAEEEEEEEDNTKTASTRKDTQSRHQLPASDSDSDSDYNGVGGTVFCFLLSLHYPPASLWLVAKKMPGSGCNNF